MGDEDTSQPDISRMCPAVSIGLALVDEGDISPDEVLSIVAKMRVLTDEFTAEEKKDRLALLDARIAFLRERK